jgi:predicted ferric reductase
MLIAQFLTSGRFEQLSGRIGIDHTMAFHKWAARVLLVVAIAHPLLFLLPLPVDRIELSWTSLLTMLGSPRFMSGTVALVLLTIIVALAVLRDRLPVPYEVWRASHGLLSLAAMWLASIHAIGVGTYSREGVLTVLWPALAAAATALFLGVHAVKTYRMRTGGWQVASVRLVADRLWELVLRRDGGRPLQYRAGQFAWLAIGTPRLLLLDNPFSLASSPAAGESLIFLIKEAGDFTRSVGQIEPGTSAGVDGPHGSFTLEGLDASAIVLVAGGAGIAPMLGILRDLAARRDARPVRLLYGGRDRDDLIDPAQILSIGALLDFEGQFFIEKAEEGWPYQTGRVGPTELARALRGLVPRRTAVMICGPGPMTAAIADAAERLDVPPKLIRYERFDYAGGHRARKDKRATAAFWGLALLILAVGTAFALR